MAKETYKGCAVGLSVLDADTMDTMRLTYNLETCKRPQGKKSNFCGYRAIALTSPHLQFEQAVTILTAAVRLVKTDDFVGTSIVFRSGGSVETPCLKVGLDWRLENYYNEADWVSLEVEASEPDCDMIFLFRPKLCTAKRLAAVRLMRSKVLDKGLPKGIVALGNESYATVSETECGYSMDLM
jgi:hypothetical protein